MPVIVDEEAEMVDLWGNKLMIVEIPWEMTQNTISSQMLDWKWKTWQGGTVELPRWKQAGFIWIVQTQGEPFQVNICRSEENKCMNLKINRCEERDANLVNILL